MWPEGPFTRISYELLQLSSTKQIREWLLSEGWAPDQDAFDEWNYKKDKRGKMVRGEDGKPIKMAPKMTIKGELVQSLEIFIEETGKPALKLLASYFQHTHRSRLLKGLLDNVDMDDTIRAGIIPNATPTARAAHKVVVNIPSVDSFFGPELRSLFTHRDGYEMVGWDASALEARVEASYTYKYDDGAYAQELLEGDIHSKNAEVFGVSRGVAKGGKYALTYGCSPGKLGSTLNKSAAEAKFLYDEFWEANRSLGELKSSLEKVFTKRQDLPKPYIKGLDGRQIYIRYRHALLNSLFQSGGSIIVKNAFVKLAQVVKKRGLRVNFLGFYHDEVQAEVHPGDVEEYSRIAIRALKWSGEDLEVRVPITGEAKVGSNWKDCH